MTDAWRDFWALAGPLFFVAWVHAFIMARRAMRDHLRTLAMFRTDFAQIRDDLRSIQQVTRDPTGQEAGRPDPHHE